jgi:hypothetical protein
MRRRYLPIEQLEAWAKLNGVRFNHTRVERITTPDGQQKGAGVFITEDFETTPDHEAILLSVPHELILSKDLVHDYAKSDVHLREVLEAVGEFGRVSECMPLGAFTGKRIQANICRAREVPS